MRLVSSSRSRLTGTLVSVIDNRDGGFESESAYDEAPRAPEGCLWATVCEDHGTYVMHATRRLAVWFAPYPDNFCDECRALVDAGQKVSDA